MLALWCAVFPPPQALHAPWLRVCPGYELITSPLACPAPLPPSQEHRHGRGCSVAPPRAACAGPPLCRGTRGNSGSRSGNRRAGRGSGSGTRGSGVTSGSRCRGGASRCSSRGAGSRNSSNCSDVGGGSTSSITNSTSARSSSGGSGFGRHGASSWGSGWRVAAQPPPAALGAQRAGGSRRHQPRLCRCGRDEWGKEAQGAGCAQGCSAARAAVLHEHPRPAPLCRPLPSHHHHTGQPCLPLVWAEPDEGGQKLAEPAAARTAGVRFHACPSGGGWLAACPSCLPRPRPAAGEAGLGAAAPPAGCHHTGGSLLCRAGQAMMQRRSTTGSAADRALPASTARSLVARWQPQLCAVSTTQQADVALSAPRSRPTCCLPPLLLPFLPAGGQPQLRAVGSQVACGRGGARIACRWRAQEQQLT